MTQQAFATPAELTAALLATPALLGELVAPLSAAAAGALVDHLKNEADRHWWINANQSLVFAGLIVQIGRLRGDAWQTALGTMARGDALKFVGNIQEAWNLLGEAGALFASIGDAVGWARTRIGRMLISVELSRVDEALADAERAREVFLHNHIQDKLLVLELNTAIVYNLLGDQQRAIEIYSNVIELANKIGGNSDRYIRLAHNCLGNAYNALGAFRQAILHYELAHRMFCENGEYRAAAIANLNIGHIAITQGNFHQALHLLYSSHNILAAENLHVDAANIRRDMIECYIALNRYSEARDIANDIIKVYQQNASDHREAITLLHLASAEAGLDNRQAANQALNQAERIFSDLGAATWLALTQLRRGKIALAQGDIETSENLIQYAITSFVQYEQQMNSASAILLMAEIHLRKQELQIARKCANQSFLIARNNNAASLRYSAHVLLARIEEFDNRAQRARRHYQAAISTIERIERGLSITLRPGFLDDKNEAFHGLMRLYIQKKQFQRAYETLERTKSLTWLSYLNNRNQLRWPTSQAQTQSLVEQLNQLREEHQWYYRLAFEEVSNDERNLKDSDRESARRELYSRERHMRAITEQLYLQADNTLQTHITPPHLQEIQAALEPDTLLIEYYCDAQHIYAFCVTTTNLYLERLPITLSELAQSIRQLQLNIAAALKIEVSAPALAGLTSIGKRVLQKLFTGVLGMQQVDLARFRRLVIVPSGVLHYLPFHLLYNENRYLIECHEVTLLPAAGLLLRQSLRRPAGALALAHPWEGRLPNTLREAQIVYELFGGRNMCEEAATRSVFDTKPVQVLHVAAHGEHRLDQPDLSYFQLADGQVYTDDLFQHDLSYELVTLSACETGRAYVTAGDELIGLGRGFLYAGAASLITSLWRVADDITVTFMGHLYRSLHNGASKAESIRNAQLIILQTQPSLHPAFWGAFQLVGHAGPLSRSE